MIRRTDSQGDVIHFFKIKDLHYFKELLLNFDHSIVREFLQNSIEVVKLVPFVSYQPEPGYHYIPSQNGILTLRDSKEQIHLRQGYAIGDIKEEIVSNEVLSLYRLSTKTEMTLQRLYHLNMPVLSNIKCWQKLVFYGKCGLLDVNYGTYVYRKGEPIEAIYYILEGQVKISKKKKEGFVELNTLQKGKYFGVACMKYGKLARELIARASQNGTQILVMYRWLLEEVARKKEVTLDKLLESVKSQLSSIVRTKKVFGQRKEDLENERRERELTLQKRVREFEGERMIKNKFIQNLAQTKTLFVKVRDLNTAARKRSDQSRPNLLANISATILSRCHNSTGRTRYRQTEAAAEMLGKQRQSLNDNHLILRNFKGLTRYPSVQRYMNHISKRQ